ncbi:MAG: AI-2E family transporter [Cellulomonadaceae bacterium]
MPDSANEAKSPSSADRGTAARSAPAGVTKRVAGTRRVQAPAPVEQVPGWLRTSAGWSWRMLLVVAVVALLFWATSQVQLVFIAVFVALVFTAVLRPVVDLYHKIMPRGLAVALALLTAILLVAGLLTYVITSVAGQWSSLADQFTKGINQIFDFLENGPLPISYTYDDFTKWLDSVGDWVQEHAGSIAGAAASQAGSVFEVFTALALAVFCTIFFLFRGQSMWMWFLGQLPARARETWHRAANAGWFTFSGYTRGTVMIALTDGVLAAILLVVIGVPLAAPLAVLVFIGAFIPLIGAPGAMVIAMIVALAADGIVKAAIVGVGIALIGQFEGHVLQPLVMGKQVSLHPVVIALVVTAGTLTAGILGAVIAVPLVAVAWTVFEHLRTPPPPLDPDSLDPGDPRPTDDDLVVGEVDG